VLVIRAVSFKGRPLGGELTARFGEAGGTIGRGDTSTLVLPDPERYISRTHATISFQAGGFIVTDNGTKNPVMLNDRPLGTGQWARLADGDTIKIGDYALAVSLAAPAPAAIPPGTPGASPLAPPGGDPLAAFPGASARADDPFADLLRPEPPGLRPAAPGTPGGPPAAIPRSPGPGPADPLADLRGREPSVDELFGLKGAEPRELLPPDALDPPGVPPRRAGAVDPLEVLRGTARPVPPPSVPDHGPEIFTPYAPPVARPDVTPEVKVERMPPPAAPMPGAPIPAPPAMPPPPAPPVASTPPLPARAEATAPLEPLRSAPRAPGPIEHALLRSFLRGAGIPEGRMPGGLTPEAMESIGTLLRSAIQGTLDLLRARGLIKSEMRADMTMIMAQDNNPLKFSPTAEAALAQLLAPPIPGFMPPARALGDAYDDLRAHQLGFLAGMRAALEEVLGRFAPAELETRLSDPSMLDSLLPMHRKARLWDLFVERYQDVAGDAREDFNATFGKAFLRAYQEQVKRLRAGGRPA
jgi:FHA domain-containing protein